MLDIQKMLTKTNIEQMVKHGTALVKDNLPAIFAVSAVGCFGLSVYETAVATHKSDMDIAKEEERRAAALPLYENVELSTAEKVELCWKNYIKAALYGGACIFFIVASERKGNEKYLAVMSAYELSRKAGEERKDVEVDILGEEKANEIETETRKRMVKNISTQYEDIQSTDSRGDKTLYVEPFTNTPFWATHEELLHAFNHVNYMKNKQGAASINDLLEALDCRKEIIAEDWGWREEDDMVLPSLGEAILLDDDPSRPATLIGYSVEPKYDYGSDRHQW